MPIRVVKTGRFFDAAVADAETAAAVDGVARDVALHAFRLWNILLDARIKVNQYRYMSGNVFEPRDGGWVVHDDFGKPYGPWLEGVGSRNSSQGFPGYHALSEAAHQTEGNVGAIAEERISALVSKLNESGA